MSYLCFTILNRGKTLGNYAKNEITMAELQTLKTGGKELEDFAAGLDSAI